MDKAAFDLLERLTQTMLSALYRERTQKNPEQIKLNIEVEISDLNELLDKARHEQKGGA